jgi:hypothetical protein
MQLTNCKLNRGDDTMAISKAKKMRNKLAKAGKRNPEAGRSPFAQMDLTTRRSKTKYEQIHTIKHKNHASIYGDDGSFYFYRQYDLCA